MPQAVTVYRWDDPGAPSLSTFNWAAISNLLKKCLVDGYGTKDPLGWTLEGENTDVLLFRNDPIVGSGGYVRFEKHPSMANYFYVITAQSALGLAMSDLFNTGYLGSVTRVRLRVVI